MPPQTKDNQEKSTVVSVRLPKQIIQKIQAAAGEEGETLGQLVKRIVMNNFNQ